MADIALPDEWIDRIKAATRDLTKKAGGQVRAAQLCGWGKSTVDRWGSARHADVIPLMAALILERDVGFPYVTQAMAEFNGLALGAREEGPGSDCLTDSFLQVSRAKADLVTSVIEAQADGTLTINEAIKIDGKLGRLVEKATRMRETVARKKAKGAKP